MELFAAIHGRRSMGLMKQDPVDKATIKQLLEAATKAPNHRLTEPWRFIVMTDEGRRLLGEGYARVAGATTQEEKEPHIRKAFRAPVVIAVVCSPVARPDVIRIEEFAAVHAAVQNMLLAAHGLGLAAIWRSGEPMYHAAMKETFGLADHEELVGFVYIGHPNGDAPAEKPRRPIGEVTRWVQS